VIAAIGDHYQVEGEIGRGGMSVVYRARDLRLNRSVAIKVLPPDLAHDPAVRTRFAREAHTAAQLSHPHIAPIFDVGEREGIAYFVMGLVSGGSLAALLAREPRQPIGETRRLLSEIADALAFAHTRGVIHRDIKPDNILLDRDTGRAVVTDFGIARAMEAGTRLTNTGIAVGTPAYMSPEQATGERQVDGRSDIYSLGVLGYQMLTGRVPFRAGNTVALLMKHVHERPRPIAELRPEAPRALCQAIERALMKEPDDRWPTAAALRDALRSGDAAALAWRPESEPARHDPPNRGSRAVEERPAAPAAAPQRGKAGVPMEPEHLAALTAEQKADLRLWHGRTHLLERVKALRGYALFTIGMWMAGFGAFVGGVEEGIPPLVLAPVVPFLMTLKLWRRGKSLKQSGLKLWRVFLMPRSRWALPAPPPVPTEEQLKMLAPRETLEGPQGGAIRRAAEDRAVILDLVAKLPRADREMLPDIVPTADALLERVAHLAQALDRIEEGVDARLGRDLDSRIADAERDSVSPDARRRLELLRRQRATLEDLARRRSALAQQIESAGLALRNLRLDLVKLRSSGLESALSDVSTATQQARALSREIGVVLDAADEVREL
jgi:serine/threonine-protein kinase